MLRKTVQSRTLAPHMANSDSNLEVIPRTVRGAKSEHDKLLEELRAHVSIPDDYHPVISMAIIANNSRLPLNMQLKAHAEVAAYLFRKLKPVDAPVDKDREVPTARLVIERAPPGLAPNVVVNDEPAPDA